MGGAISLCCVVLRGVSFTFDEDEGPGQYPTVADEVDAVEFARTRLGFDPDARQWGKSTVAAAVRRAYSRGESLVLLATPSERQSGEFLRKASRMVMRLGITPRGDGDNAMSLLFPNGSRIVGLPGSEGTVRGFSAVSLLLIDEAARVEEGMYQALRPMLAVGNGDLWMMSTPWAREGFFYESWTYGGEGWCRVMVPATECSRIGRDFLEEERGVLGAAVFAREYMCEFLDCGGVIGIWWRRLWMMGLSRWSCCKSREMLPVSRIALD